MLTIGEVGERKIAFYGGGVVIASIFIGESNDLVVLMRGLV